MTISQANPPWLGPEDGRDSIMTVGPERREEALSRLLAADGGTNPEHARRFLRYARDHSVPLDCLWGSVDARGRFQGVVLAVPGAGRSAMVFASHGRTEAQRTCTAKLLKYAGELLPGAGVCLAQGLLDPDDLEAHETFHRGGFRPLATLTYLQRPLRTRLLPPEPDWPEGVSLESCERTGDAELIATLDATYEQTMDCPALRGLRQTSDILEGHRAAGAFDPRLWTLLRVDGQSSGVLLLNASSDRASIELVYLGLARGVRGRGLGLRLLQHGLRLIASRPERSMTLAVDQTNAPALRLYEREHFRAVLQRSALVLPMRAARG